MSAETPATTDAPCDVEAALVRLYEIRGIAKAHTVPIVAAFGTCPWAVVRREVAAAIAKLGGAK